MFGSSLSPTLNPIHCFVKIFSSPLNVVAAVVVGKARAASRGRNLRKNTMCVKKETCHDLVVERSPVLSRAPSQDGD